MPSDQPRRGHALRVLTVGNMYPPHHRGGYELVWASAVDHLERCGHDVRVLTTTHREPDVTPTPADDRARRELRWYWHDDSWPQLSPLDRVGLERHNRRILLAEIAEFRPHVVCWWAMGGMSLSMIETVSRLGVAEAFVLCDDWLAYGPRVDGWMRAMRRLGAGAHFAGAITGVPATLRRARTGPALYPSRWLRDRGRAEGWRFGDEHIVGQGVPRDLFEPSPPGEWSWKLACVGRLDERKGVDLAIGALASLPSQAQLSIVGSAGDREYRAELVAMAEQLDVADRVRFSTVSRDALRSVYADADVVVFPVRWPEPWGLVPLEAMSVGRPVVATGRGGSGEYLRDRENCVLFDPDLGPDGLADAVRTLADDPVLRDRVRDGGSDTSRSYGEGDFDRAVETLVTQATLDAGAGNRRPSET